MTEQDNKSPVQEAPPMKLDVSVRAIEPKGNLLGFANVKFNDCFVVEDFKILQTDKGLYVGMPSKPDKSSKTGYRDTAKPITGEFRKQLHGAILTAYSDACRRWPQHRSGLPLKISWRPVPKKRPVKKLPGPRRRSPQKGRNDDVSGAE